MTNPTPTSGAADLPAIQRYKIGYHSDDWGQRSSTPSGIPDASGSWVRYADHVAALAARQAVAQPVSTWCDGCSPENCVGCHIPSDAAAPAQTVAKPTREFLERTLAAMEGVIDVADRKTAEFDALRSCVIDLTLMLFKPTTRPAPPAMDASPSAASIAWNALRDATDPLGELGARIMGHVRIFAQRQYEAGRDEVRPAPPAMDGGEDAERWEFRWLNPANKQNVAPSELAWKTVNSKGMRSEKEVLEDLKTYRYQGKPVYELRPLFATRALQKPEIRCPVRLANGGDCPRHNLQCGWPDCNKETK